MWRHTSQELFGISTHNPNILYARKLDFFCNQIPSELKITPNYIINRMTIFPLFKPFMPIERANRVIEGMVGDGSGSVHAGIGPNTGQVFLKEGQTIKICKSCLKSDRKDYGEAYFHRIHQIPGNFLCVKHNTPLNYFLVQNDKSSYEINIDSFYDSEFESYQIKPSSAQYFFLGEDIEFVLNGGLSNFSINTINQRYKQRLQEKGYVSIGRIKQSRLISDFKQFYPIDFLEGLESNFEDENMKSWLRIMTNDSKKSIHPIRHLLFIRFLFGGVKDFLKYSWEYKPFGDSPYPCLNSVADHYKKDVIQSCDLKRTNYIANPVGAFKCDCGFVYSRQGPDKTENDRYRYGKVMQYGHIWEGKLKELVDKSSDIKYIAQEMKCYRDTVIKYANILGIVDKLDTKLRIMPKKIGNKISDTELNVYKEQINQYIINNPDNSRVQIRRALPQQYFLLRRRDEEWLEEILPKAFKNESIFENYSKCIDWKPKDEELFQKIKQIVSLILIEEKPRRITRNLIAKKANHNSDRKTMVKNFPRTEEYLLSCCETVEDFRQRKT